MKRDKNVIKELQEKINKTCTDRGTIEATIEYLQGNVESLTKTENELNGILKAYSIMEDTLKTSNILNDYIGDYITNKIDSININKLDDNFEDGYIKRILSYVEDIRKIIKIKYLEQIKLYPNNTYEIVAEDIITLGIIEDLVDHDLVNSTYYEIELKNGEYEEIAISDVENYTEEQAIDLYKKAVVETE